MTTPIMIFTVEDWVEHIAQLNRFTPEKDSLVGNREPLIPALQLLRYLDFLRAVEPESSFLMGFGLAAGDIKASDEEVHLDNVCAHIADVCEKIWASKENADVNMRTLTEAAGYSVAYSMFFALNDPENMDFLPHVETPHTHILNAMNAVKNSAYFKATVLSSTEPTVTQELVDAIWDRVQELQKEDPASELQPQKGSKPAGD